MYAVPAGAPLNFTAIGVSSTSVRLQWDPPARQHRNGEIVLYELLYHDRRDPADDWPTNTTDTSIVIDGLQPTTNYIFQIRAYTGKGPGPWSNQLPFQTFAAQRTLFVYRQKLCYIVIYNVPKYEVLDHIFCLRHRRILWLRHCVFGYAVRQSVRCPLAPISSDAIFRYILRYCVTRNRR